MTNFLVVVADQLRADALGAATPNLDRLAAGGARFTNAYAQHPVCAPSRASFLSGWYPHTAGHRSFGTPLRADEPNFLRTFRENGYHVTWVGDRGDTFGPGATELAVAEHGFTTKPSSGRWGDGPAPASPPFPHERWGRLFYRGRVHDPEDVDFDEAAVRTAERWLAAPPAKPWVLFAPLVAPHCPFQATEPWFSLHDRDSVRPPVSGSGPEPAYLQGIRDYYGTSDVTLEMWREVAATYYGMVSRLDHHVGRLVDAAGPDTVVVFFSDHGEYLGDFGVVEKWPSALHSCITRDPLIISGPGVPAAGPVDAMVELVDVFPTLLDLAGIPAGHAHFGRSLLPVLRDPSTGHREYAFSEGGFLVEEEPKFERAPYPYDLKCALQHDRPATVGKAVAVRDRRWTYVWRLYEPAEVYDRAADLDEAHNLAGQPAGRRRRGPDVPGPAPLARRNRGHPPGAGGRTATGREPAYALNGVLVAQRIASEFREFSSPYFGGQKINEVLTTAATQVSSGWEYLPYQLCAETIFSDTAGQAYVNNTDLNAGLRAWQESLVEYGNQQGFSVNAG